jgi:hypothetical protein
MTTDRVDAIRSRLSAATPGPWELDSFDDPRESRTFTAVDDEPLVCSTTRYDADYERFEDFDDERFLAQREADGQLVANAPADLAWLLEENARLTAELDKETQKREALQSACATMAQVGSGERDTLRTALAVEAREVDRLTTQVTELLEVARVLTQFVGVRVH